MKKCKIVILMAMILISCGKNDHNNYSNDGVLKTTRGKTISHEGDIERFDCNEETAIFIGYLYYYSNPLEIFNNFRTIESNVIKNSNYLQPNSPTIICMREAGERLIRLGINTYNPGDKNRAYESVLNMGGTAEMANDISNKVSNGSLTATLIGQELIWLSQVLPKAAEGDWSDFLNSGTMTRKQAIEYIKLIAPFLDQASLRILQETMDMYSEQMVYEMALMISFVAE